ncbi:MULTISPECIES: amino acid ABC transporter permease [Pseudomonadati]|mgnify:CR=1 FL=1|jgi:general L-amino acid transport system permease protein|uniref:General L-amino acid transport system permease protein n=1 Tax=Rhizobium soli TaxID=424798 RepID=A0A7X0JL18_9HYPH|nr:MULTISPECIES: amino acid ABC transporter permease [Rhizobium]RYE69087.1 MAG: amino acid ABC transporter permease [Rhizobiaceae bacterium]KQQ72340.1 amino acid ABC transporter permease [Rhizobium sp. Leaf321]MBB6509586.1 general L-amino acid transport system permease protein [Rhizobium soli]MBD8650273.1 amino acid ABC transporter permease [Rhizobium sp. CFBP 13726]MBD8663320.1 amino acid ABC transporter permease [Rhizobium sp. CFBP 8752]
MSTHKLSYVRNDMIAPEPPPVSASSASGWIRTNLLATPKDVVLTIVAIALLAFALPGIINWLFINASWVGADRSVCATVVQGGTQPDGWKGACWAFVGDRFQQFMFGRYPIEERWRVMLVGFMLIVLLVPLLIPKLPYKALNAVLLFLVYPVVSFFLMHGNVLGLQRVETPLWGGMMVTLILSFVGIAVSFPVGILLALGRRSNMRVLKTLCVVFIEVIRGVPLVMVLFMANVMLPLFLPTGWSIDNFLRAVIGVSLFASAYMAEVIRGGLQAIPKGQGEGADSLGLSYWQKTRLIVLPQAIKLVIPGIVNTFIGLFKDTSLVAIIGMFDLLNIIRLNFTDTTWITPMTPLTGLVFAGLIYWIFCFGMSRYSAFMERHLDTGHKR